MADMKRKLIQFYSSFFLCDLLSVSLPATVAVMYPSNQSYSS